MKPKDPLPAPENVDATDFVLSSMSHELRTPLSAILLWAKVLSEQGEPSKQQLKEGLRAIRECAEEQDALIQDIVDDSRVAVGKISLRPEPVDVREQIEHVLGRCKNEATKKGVVIHPHFDSRLGGVVLDPRRFQQIIASLLDQAIKRSPIGGRVLIGTERRGDCLDVSVKDSGPGFGAEELVHVFDRIPAGPARWKAKGNSPFTASRLAFLLNGSLGVKNNGRERGAVFTLTLSAPLITVSSDELAKGKVNARDFQEEKRSMTNFAPLRPASKKSPMANNPQLGLA